MVQAEASGETHGHFNVLDIETSLRADMYCLGDDTLGTWAMERRRCLQVVDADIWIAPIEYVIVKKLEYYRMAGSDRHLDDIAAMRRISGETIDAAVLASWIDRLGLEPEWQLAERRSPA